MLPKIKFSTFTKYTSKIFIKSCYVLVNAIEEQRIHNENTQRYVLHSKNVMTV